MTAEARGAYISMLCHAWEGDGIEDDMKTLKMITGAKTKAILEAKKKFFRQKNGKLYNKRQEETRSKLEDYREAQSEKARKSWEKRKSEPQASHKLAIGEPMPYQSQNQSKSQSQKRESARGASDDGAGGAEIPTEAEVIDYGDRAGVPAWYAKKFYAKKEEARTWANKFGMLKDWRREMVRWYAEDGRPTNAPEPKGTKPAPEANGKPATPWEIKTTLEAVTTKLTENRNRHRADVAGGEYVWDDTEARAMDRKLVKRKRQLNDQLAAWV